MSIAGYTKDTFGVRLNEVLSPSLPIRSPENLKGREHELDLVERALFATGRHVFVFGARGVGKSSLAATAAFQYQSSDAAPIFVSGATDETFRNIIANLVMQAVAKSRTESHKRRHSASLSLHGLKIGTETEVTQLDIASQIQTTGDAVELLKYVADTHSQKPIVVLDEFDAIRDAQERNKFAGLLKQLGDQGVNIKFIFTGVGSSVEELIGAHASAFRQLETRELPRLPWEARREIVENAAGAFGLSVDNNVNWRIAAVSDGFPHYVHLIAEKMLWEAFAEDVPTTELGTEHYQQGLRMAIESINVELKRPYEKAVIHRAMELEDVVWSTADGEDLFRPLSDMHQSYRVVVGKRQDRQLLNRAKYSDLVRKLKAPGYGSVLEQLENRPGWYCYKEKMLRGYVRMQAEVNGVELSGERPIPRQKMHIASNAKTGVRGPTIPRGVDQNRPIRDDSDAQEE